MTPFPIPLTTPPDTSINLVIVGQMSLGKEKSGGLVVDLWWKHKLAQKWQTSTKISIAIDLPWCDPV
jgi:hypothetical protein